MRGWSPPVYRANERVHPYLISVSRGYFFWGYRRLYHTAVPPALYRRGFHLQPHRGGSMVDERNAPLPCFPREKMHQSIFNFDFARVFVLGLSPSLPYCRAYGTWQRQAFSIYNTAVPPALYRRGFHLQPHRGGSMVEEDRPPPCFPREWMRPSIFNPRFARVFFFG